MLLSSKPSCCEESVSTTPLSLESCCITRFLHHVNSGVYFRPPLHYLAKRWPSDFTGGGPVRAGQVLHHRWEIYISSSEDSAKSPPVSCITEAVCLSGSVWWRKELIIAGRAALEFGGPDYSHSSLNGSLVLVADLLGREKCILGWLYLNFH